MSAPCAIMLAAGDGSRYRAQAGPDQDKLLAICTGRDGSRRPVLEHSVRAVAEQMQRVLLVTRADNTGVLALARRLEVEVLAVVSTGMGDSLAAAVRHSADSAGWLVCLGDMPFILPQTIAQVATALDDDIVVPTHGGQYGHPVGFGRRHGPALATLGGERGAKPLLQRHPPRELALDDPGVLWDVDTPAALDFAG